MTWEKFPSVFGERITMQNFPLPPGTGDLMCNLGDPKCKLITVEKNDVIAIFSFSLMESCEPLSLGTSFVTTGEALPAFIFFIFVM
jgi:hypothetical protein